MDRNAPPITAETTGIFLSVGLPLPVAQAFAGTRPLHQIDVGEISATLLGQYRIAMTACPLIGAEMDALVVANALHKAGYSGILSVISPRLPNSRMVEEELRATCPAFRINVISL